MWVYLNVKYLVGNQNHLTMHGLRENSCGNLMSNNKSNKKNSLEQLVCPDQSKLSLITQINWETDRVFRNLDYFLCLSEIHNYDCNISKLLLIFQLAFLLS